MFHAQKNTMKRVGFLDDVNKLVLFNDYIFRRLYIQKLIEGY